MHRLLGRYSFSTLTQTMAELRPSLIERNSIRYHTHLTLHKGSSYNGLTNITFNILPHTHHHHPLRLDFTGKQVSQLLVNEHVVEPKQHQSKDGILIPHSYLQEKGQNNIIVEYTNQYDKDGSGCVSFTDVDDKQYLYTQFEPYAANRVIPHFDQPDLKAPWTLTVACPNEWGTVLSNEFPDPKQPKRFTVCDVAQKVIRNFQKLHDQVIDSYQSKIPDDYKKIAFLPTQTLPSYLYCVAVGPYKELEINTATKGTKEHVPMKLYSIESLYNQLQRLAPFIEEMTVGSLNFFSKYFGHPYAFSKYDQVFAHEYKWGAMENAGLVTLNDLYLFKDQVSTERMLSFGNTIVHQFSHHWFGNLVTMKWWDDLWLNQSFAEYISHYCLEKLKSGFKTISFESAMVSFLARKSWGYSEDQMVTTHPIRGSVSDTHNAESIFDGITYSKGAATMKQLMYLIGQDSFSKVLSTYFYKYAFSNAVLDDLLNEIQPYFKNSGLGISMNDWKKMWLQTSGCNVISCKWKAGGKELVISQGTERVECPTLRLHRIKVAFIQENHEIIEKEVLVLPQEKTVINVQIPATTVAVLPNYQDLTFAKINIDSVSRDYFAHNLNHVQDSLSRALVWKSYFNMLKECRIASKEYISFVCENLGEQKSDPILEEQIGYMASAIASYTPKKYRQNLYHKAHSFLKNQLLSTVSEGNRKVILRDKLIDFSQDLQSQKELSKWYYADGDLAKQELNITLRWKIVIRLLGRTALSRSEKEELLTDMKKRDSSDTMINKTMTCETLLADEQGLEQVYQKLFKEDSGLSSTNTTHLMRGYNHSIHQSHLIHTHYPRYFSDVARFLKGQVEPSQQWFLKGDYLENFITQMDPHCDNSTIDLTCKVESYRELEVTHNDKIKRLILKKIDLLERRKRVYQFYESKQAVKQPL